MLVEVPGTEDWLRAPGSGAESRRDEVTLVLQKFIWWLCGWPGEGAKLEVQHCRTFFVSNCLLCFFCIFSASPKALGPWVGLRLSDHLPPRLVSVSLWLVGAHSRLPGPSMLSPRLMFLLLDSTNVVSIHTQVTAASATGSSSSAHGLPPPGGVKGTEAGCEPQPHLSADLILGRGAVAWGWDQGSSHSAGALRDWGTSAPTSSTNLLC